MTAKRESLVDRKSTRLNSSHSQISYAVFCLKKKRALSASSLNETAMSLDGTASLRDLFPPTPPLLDCVVQRPPARAECGIDDHEDDQHEGVDDSGPDVRGAGTVLAPEPLRHRPDDEAQQNAAGVG